MKHYCKKANIYDRSQAIQAVLNCLKKSKTRKRNDTIKLFCSAGNISRKEAINSLNSRDDTYYQIVQKIADDLIRDLKNKAIEYKIVEMKQVSDGSRRKVRAVAMIPVRQLMLDHIACLALSDIFKRIAYNQYSGRLKRGTINAANKISKWLRNPKLKYVGQLDIKKCFQSIDRDLLLSWLRKYINNTPLLDLVRNLINTSPTPGLGIGSYLSQSLATLYLSRIYHFVTEELYYIRKSRHGHKRVSLVHKCLMYMDDILIFGTNFKHLKKASSKIIEKAKELHLFIKPTWQVFYIRDNCNVGKYLDVLGFKIAKNYKTIRKHIFIKARRLALRALRRLNKGQRISLTQARVLISYHGYFKYSNSKYCFNKYKLAEAVQQSKYIISFNDKNNYGNKIYGEA